MPQFGAQIDTLRIPIKGLIPEQGTAYPSTPVEGMMCHRTDLKQVFVYLNGAWVQMDNVASAGNPSNVTDGDKGVITVTGGVWALDANTVGSSQLVNGAVNSSKISDGSIAAIDLDTTSVRLDTIGAPTNTVNMNNQVLSGLAPPAVGSDAATRNYVDNIAQGLDAKNSARAATTGNITLSGLQTIDGVSVTFSDRVLVKNQTDPTQNGIYNAQSVAWNRVSDMDVAAEVPSAFVFVEEGTTQADTGWVCTTNAPVTIGSTAINWTQFSSAGSVVAGAGMTQSGQTLNVVAGDTSLLVNADEVHVNTAVIATVASLSGYIPTSATLIAGNGLTQTPGTALNSNMTVNVVPGTGLVVAADSVSLDTAYTDGRYAPISITGTVKKFSADVNAGAVIVAGTEYTVTHNLGTFDVQVGFIRKTTPAAGGAAGPSIELTWRAINANSIGVTADVGFTTNEIRATVMA